MSELYKDKIEVSLDGRQVFYLFFGGAIIVCMVFVLGVMVGKRVEARAHLDRATTTAARDPLAALDRLSADGPHELSFRQALTGGAAPASDVERKIAEMERARAVAAAPAVSPAAPAAAPAKGPGDEAKPGPVVKPAADPAAPTKHPAKPDGAKADPAAPKPDPAKPDPAKPDPAKPDTAKLDPASHDAAPIASPAEIEHAGSAKKGRYTLQLSAFQDKAEAQAFLDEVKAAGYEAFITEANVEDKGTFFRVRLGSYSTYDDAMSAKGDFERKLKKIAYVSRI